jgi:polysaccharide biosynthesis transport protein
MATQLGSFPQGIDVLLLWRKKYVLIASLLAGVGIGFGYLRLAPTTYQAQARVLIEPRGLASGLGSDPRAANLEFLPTQAETIRSPITVSRALKSVQITPPSGADLTTFNPVLFVLGSLRATPVLKANVLTIDYQSTIPEEAVAVISAVIESYRRDVTEADRGTWATNVEMIAARERELRHDLEALQSAYVELRQNSPLVGGVGHEAKVVALAKINELGSQLAETERRRFDRQTRLSAVATAQAWSEPRPPVTTQAAVGTDNQCVTRVVALKPVLSRLDSNLLEQVLPHVEPLEARSLEEVEQKLRLAKFGLEQLDATYGPKHPDLISANAEVTEFEVQLQQRLQNIVSGWKSEVQVLKAAEQRLQAAYAAERQQAKGVDVYLVKEEMLQGNIKKIEQLHATTLTQSEQIQAAEKAVAEGRSSIQMRILDGPRLLEDMMWPKPKILLAAAATLGLVAGCCFILLSDVIKRHVAASEASDECSTLPSANRDQGQDIAYGHHPELVGEAT